MAKLLLIFTSVPNRDHLSGYWVMPAVEGDNLSGEFASSRDLEGLLDQHKGASVEVYLPGESCTLHWVHLPKKNRDGLKSIPYQLEPFLLAPLAELHITPLLKLGDEANRYPVWVCNKSWLADWVDLLDNLGVSTKVVRPDYALLWLAENSDALQTLSLDDRIIFSGKQVGAGKEEQLKHMLAPADIACSVKTLASLDELQMPSGNATLLTDGLAKRLQQKSPQSYQMMAGGLFAFLLAVNFLFGVFQYQDLKSQGQLLRENTTELFNQTLPNTKRVDPLFQLQQALEQRQSAQKPSSLLKALSSVSEQLGESQGRIVQKITYEHEKQLLEIYFKGPPLTTTEGSEFEIQQQKVSGEGLHVSIVW